MTDISDLPAILETMGNKEKMDEIHLIIGYSRKGLISFDEADRQIDEVIHSTDANWKPST